jgi:murein DD-endopeptidase MepM/ murein hydrolase activator NlpD
MAALLIIVPALLAGCEERPAYVLDPDRSVSPYQVERPTFTVRVREGDSVAKIAARCDTTSAEIARLNGLGPDWPIYPGETLLVPRPPREVVAVVPRPIPRPNYVPASYEQPAPRQRPFWYGNSNNASPKETADNREQSWWSWWMKPNTTSDPAADQDAGQDSRAASSRFIWPLQGRIIEGFGGSKRGERNDGINIATQEGTPIRAAASGTVTYAGNELKGYGNLVLIRHPDGYVTAYAHAGSIRVNRGDVVERGQIIGTAGETGDVDRPQLHFEIRHGVQAVDPVQYLDRAS